MNTTIDLSHIQEIIAADSMVLDEPMLYPPVPSQQHLWMPPTQPMHSCQIQQQHQQQQQNLQQQKNPYCSTQLPDSPPDSGSEPYSPPNGERQNELQQQPFNGKPMNTLQPGYNIPPVPHSSPHSVIPPNNYRNYYQEPPKLNHQEPLHLNAQQLMNNPKKRRLLESPLPPPHHMMIKSEPAGGMLDLDEDLCGYDYCGPPDMNFLEGNYQVIKWQPYQHKTWATLLDQHYKELPTPTYRVDADKGFNFSVPDEAFVCQKKNHFQVTVHIEIHGQPKFMKHPETGAVLPLEAFFLHFNGIKMESPSQSIKIEQSQSDRSKKAFYPVRVDLPFDQTTKVTVGRLHFSETTTNNMRKKGKPNPDQRYFMLVVALHGHSGSENYPISGQVSEKIIVRASNPGQFDQDVDVTWQKGNNGDSIYHAGRVGINTDRPDEALTVQGNIKLTGHLMQPSDRRIKQDIQELDSEGQLQNITRLKVYNYQLDPQVADHLRVPVEQRKDTGVIAQEVRDVLPDAVKETGDFTLPNGRKIQGLQVVNKDRLYMENVGAVKELCKVTDKLENRIGELENMNSKLARYKSWGSISTCSSSISSKEKAEKDKENQEKKKLALEGGGRRHRPRHHCSRHMPPATSNEEGPFSNRFIQVTIFVLLLVMAFCLIAITALYVIKHHESDKKSTTTAPTTDNTGQSGSPEIPGTPGVPGTHTEKPPAIFTPLFCHNKSESCDPVCCNARGTTPKPGHGQDDPSSEGHKTVAPPYVIVNPTDKLGPSPDQQDIKFHQHTSTMHPNAIYNVYRQKRSASVREKLELKVKQDNQTLDERYCVNTDCETGQGTDFKYHILLSQVFPNSPLDIIFQVPEDDWTVDLCNHTTRDSCNGQEQVPKPSQARHLWNLPVGNFQHSQFIFRVGPVEDNQTLCSLPSSSKGRAFTVYDLTFDRQHPSPDACTSDGSQDFAQDT